MKKTEIAAKAKALGLKTGKKTKTELITAIQGAEGHEVCFATTDGSCPQWDCLWREECFVLAGAEDPMKNPAFERPAPLPREPL